ncbi:MAG: hypothetical protein ACREDZ_07310 [Kiloniellales bacterium]
MQDREPEPGDLLEDELAPLSHCQVCDLTCGERLLLAGLRLWVARFRERRCGLHELLLLFEAYRLRPVAAGLHGLLLLTAYCASRSVEVRARGALALSADEARIIAAVACAQQQGAGAAALLLGDWLPAGQARVAGAAAGEIAACCRDARLALPIRPLTGLAAGDAAVALAARPKLLH